LNQFADTIPKVEALNAVITSIHEGYLQIPSRETIPNQKGNTPD